MKRTYLLASVLSRIYFSIQQKDLWTPNISTGFSIKRSLSLWVIMLLLSTHLSIG